MLGGAFVLCALHVFVEASLKCKEHINLPMPTRMPLTGFACGSWELRGACVLLISHSGGSFSTLNISNLLQAVTRHLGNIGESWNPAWIPF